MGYSTGYRLYVHKGNKDIYEILSQTSESDFAGLNYAVDEYGDVVDHVKWYDHDVDMRKLSMAHPDIVFLLHGEGEEAGDVWKKYFKNGKMQECYAKITFNDFDENELR